MSYLLKEHTLKTYLLLFTLALQTKEKSHSLTIYLRCTNTDQECLLPVHFMFSVSASWDFVYSPRTMDFLGTSDTLLP